MNQKILPLVAAGVLVLASISIVRTQPATETNPPPTEPPRTTFGHRVAATGLVEPCSENVSIASHLPGVVERVLVVIGGRGKCVGGIRAGAGSLSSPEGIRRRHKTVRNAGQRTVSWGASEFPGRS
jgi:hypothetical protein